MGYEDKSCSTRCKRAERLPLIKQFNYRVKGTEKFWDLAGAESILQVRAALLSEDERLDKHMKTRPCLPFRRYQRHQPEGETKKTRKAG